ncbi:acyltransferase [Paenibacillus campi]|uniref:acyltransferase n=1 Tax=Paenibacillus campi TaxID=3106031 RepID=UPI002B0019AD|nr:acyltransferase [Paenibacillus sp. SGZ-1009]
MSLKQRLGEIEILRGMAFAAVVLQHSIAHYSVAPQLAMGDGARLTLLLIAAKFAVPAFIFITGLVLFYNYDGELAYGSFVRKRFNDIVVPYLLWTLFYTVLAGTFALKPIQEWIPTLLRYVFTGKSSYHLWYIVMIIPMYLLFPWLRQFVRKLSAMIQGSGRRALWLIIALTAVYEVLLLLLPSLMGAFAAWHIPVLTPYFTTYADRNIVYYLYYFVLGALAGLHIKFFLDVLQRIKWLVLLVCGVFAVYYSGLVLGGFPAETGFGRRFMTVVLLQPWMALFLVALVLLMYQLALSIDRTATDRTKRFWLTISRYSYGGYLAHAYMLRLTYMLDDRLLGGWNMTLRTVIVWLIALALSIALTYMLSKLRFGVWLTGIPERKAR